MKEKKVFLTGFCRDCGTPVSGYSSNRTIKNQGIARVKNRLCTKCALVNAHKMKGKTVKQLMENTDMDTCGCRYMSKEEIEQLNIQYGGHDG